MVVQRNDPRPHADQLRRERRTQCASTFKAALDDLITRCSTAYSKRTAVRNFMSYVDPSVGHCSRQSRQGDILKSEESAGGISCVRCELQQGSLAASSRTCSFFFCFGERAADVEPTIHACQCHTWRVCVCISPHAAFGCPQHGLASSTAACVDASDSTIGCCLRLLPNPGPLAWCHRIIGPQRLQQLELAPLSICAVFLSTGRGAS